MQQYNQLTDERLAVLAQQGDDDAFSTLFLRYQRSLHIQARKAVKRFPSFYEDEFFGYFQEKFIKLVMKYDVTKGVHFPGYCAIFFPRMAYEYARNTFQKRERIDGHRVNVGPMQPIDKEIPIEDTELDVEDYRSPHEYNIDIEDTELFAYLTEKNDEHAKVIALLVRGATYAEIATAMGRSGSNNTLTQWGLRAVNRLRRSVVEFYEQSDALDEIASLV